jgi:hypothetical protein
MRDLRRRAGHRAPLSDRVREIGPTRTLAGSDPPLVPPGRTIHQISVFHDRMLYFTLPPCPRAMACSLCSALQRGAP